MEQITKKCRVCGKVKDASYGFYPNRLVCAKCCSKMSMEYTKTERGAESHKRAVAKYNASEHGAAKNKAYRESPAGRESQRKGRRKFYESGRHDILQKRYYEKYPERKAAKDMLRAAVRYGKIDKPDRCSKCGEKGLIHGHHTDYYKPLDVQWLCQPCHSEAHNGR